MRNSFDRPSGVEFQGKWRWNDAKSNSFAGQPCDTVAKFDRNKPHTTPPIASYKSADREFNHSFFSLFFLSVSLFFFFFLILSSNSTLQNFANFSSSWENAFPRALNSGWSMSRFVLYYSNSESLGDEDVFSPASREPSLWLPRKRLVLLDWTNFRPYLFRSSTWWDCNLILRVFLFLFSID